MPKLYRPTGSFAVATKEGNRLYGRFGADGEPSLFSADDEAVKKHPELFEEYDLDGIVQMPATVVSAPPVEQATRAPGEKRPTRRKTTKAS